ncbi:MAG: VWA domain-containing protein [Desulfobacterales bacterium]|nr:VWA domain-containing protein [Desulfobacterales bacterium]
MKRYIYPFTAIIGQEPMKTALILNAVDPSIGGVLITGHKGTGKSTAARALAQILPEIEVVEGCPFHCAPDEPNTMDDACLERYSTGESLPKIKRPMPLVELPLNATEDRLVGTLHIEHALHTGKRRFEPGLLADANRGILYVDEVNLLDDHLVDMLLDSAASGVNVVEREGISYTHPARFMLIGTMNPEEGDLRPQFLDRFGLSVMVTGLDNLKDRMEIIRRRIDFEQDPEKFLKTWAEFEKLLAGQIIYARKILSKVIIPEEMLDLAVRLATEVKVHGHRADITILKAARALAALMERNEVQSRHIAEVARFVLPHRISEPMATPDLLREKLDAALKRVIDEAAAPGGEEDGDDIGNDNSVDFIDMETPGPTAASNVSLFFSFFKEKEKKKKIFDADEFVCVADINMEELKLQGAAGGRRARMKTVARSGRYVQAAPVRKGERSFDVAVDATLRAAILRQARNDPESPRSFSVIPDDLRKKVRKRLCHSLIIFVVDASDSMGAGTFARMTASKGAVLALLKGAYQNRDRVGLVAFRDEYADVLLQPTTSLTLAKDRLRMLPTGGATPFADGLLKAWQLVKVERTKDPEIKPLLVVISDGEANVPLESTRILSARKVLEEVCTLAQHIRQDKILSVVIDTKPRSERSDSMTRVAESLGASYHHIDRLKAANVVDAIQAAKER